MVHLSVVLIYYYYYYYYLLTAIGFAPGGSGPYTTQLQQQKHTISTTKTINHRDIIGKVEVFEMKTSWSPAGFEYTALMIYLLYSCKDNST
jgi:hypothetical protein